MPVYDKPMIYYPLSVLMTAGIRKTLFITTAQDLPGFERLLGDGSQLGMEIEYRIQDAPNGLAEAFLIGESFIEGERSCLILGDNLFYGERFQVGLNNAITNSTGATIFGYPVAHPEEYGVVEFDESSKVISLEEKPKVPRSKYAIPGLYCYDENVVDYAKALKPSARGELEITDLNRIYLEQGRLHVQLIARGAAWLDTGSADSLLEASQFVQTMQHRTNVAISCIEEIAYHNNWIDAEQLEKLGRTLEKTRYGQYILSLLPMPTPPRDFAFSM